MGGFTVGGTRRLQTAPVTAPIAAKPAPTTVTGPLGAVYDPSKGGTVGTKASTTAAGGAWYRDPNGQWKQSGSGGASRLPLTRAAGSGSGQSLSGSGGALMPGGDGAAVPANPGALYGGGGIADFASMFGGGGAGGAGGAGGSGGTVAGGGDLSLTAERSPDLDKAAQQYEQQLQTLRAKTGQVDQNLQFQIDEYKKRLGDGPTTRSIERAASAIRDQMAGMSNDAEAAGAAMGRGPGFAAGGIGEAGQRALAGASADISLGRERDLDALVLGGQDLMAAPGRRELAYDTLTSDFSKSSPYAAMADYGMAEKKLGLDAYLGSGDLDIRRAAAQRDQYGSPMDWFKMLYGGL